MRRTPLGNLVAHDHLTLEILAPYLRDLDARWPQGGMALRHVWTCASPGARYGFEPALRAAHAIRLADRLSAEGVGEGLDVPEVMGFPGVRASRNHFSQRSPRRAD